MPIDVVCTECGHELAVSDEMEGRMGRCPECDAVISIPAESSKPPRGGAFTPVPRNRPPAPSGGMIAMANFLSFLAVAALLCFAYIGVYTGVTAFKGPESFGGPFGLFQPSPSEVGLSSDSPSLVESSPAIVGAAFCIGGLLVGFLSFFILLATSQAVKMFVSLEHSLREIAAQLGEGD